MPTIRESGQARPSGVAHCPGGEGPRRLAAAVGKPADSMENVIQNHGDVVNRSGWTDGRSTPYPVLRTGHPRTRRYIRLLDGRAVATGIRPNRRSPEPGAFMGSNPDTSQEGCRSGTKAFDGYQVDHIRLALPT